MWTSACVLKSMCASVYVVFMYVRLAFFANPLAASGAEIRSIALCAFEMLWGHTSFVALNGICLRQANKVLGKPKMTWTCEKTQVASNYEIREKTKKCWAGSKSQWWMVEVE